MRDPACIPTDVVVILFCNIDLLPGVQVKIFWFFFGYIHRALDVVCCCLALLYCIVTWNCANLRMMDDQKRIKIMIYFSWPLLRSIDGILISTPFVMFYILGMLFSCHLKTPKDIFHVSGIPLQHATCSGAPLAVFINRLGGVRPGVRPHSIRYFRVHLSRRTKCACEIMLMSYQHNYWPIKTWSS